MAMAMIFYHFRGFRDILSIFMFRFVGVPRVFEKIEEGMKAAGAKSGLKKKVRKPVRRRMWFHFCWKKTNNFFQHILISWQTGRNRKHWPTTRLKRGANRTQVLDTDSLTSWSFPRWRINWTSFLISLFSRCTMPLEWSRAKRMAMQSVETQYNGPSSSSL